MGWSSAMDSGGADRRDGAAYCDQKVANREIRVWHFVIENGIERWTNPKTPRCKVRKRHDPKWVGGVLDLSIIQGAVSVAPWQTRISRFATFSSSPYSGGSGAARGGGGTVGARLHQRRQRVGGTHERVRLPYAITLVYSDGKGANRDVRGFGWEVAHEAVTRRPPISLDTMVLCTEGYAYDVGVWDLSIVRGPFSVAPCQTLALRFACASLYGSGPVSADVRLPAVSPHAMNDDIQEGRRTSMVLGVHMMELCRRPSTAARSAGDGVTTATAACRPPTVKGDQGWRR
jgi:hypothetical protein